MSVEQSKRLSWLLRHGANEAGISMDAAGWVGVSEVLRFMSMTRDELEAAVVQNTKKRLQLDGERVRCCQGHSLAGTPVTLDALERSWAAWEGEGSLFHGTFLDALPSIAEQGIVPQQRTHVHLTDDVQSKVGKRTKVHAFLEVDPERLAEQERRVFVAPNGVVLVRDIPPQCVTRVLGVTKRARLEQERLNGLFGV